jgi:hypothetical protein
MKADDHEVTHSSAVSPLLLSKAKRMLKVKITKINVSFNVYGLHSGGSRST